MSPRRQDEPNIVPSVLDRLLGDDRRPVRQLSADSELDAVWARLLDAAAARLRPEVVDAWVRPCRLLGVEGNQWRVAVPDRLLRDRLVQQYLDALQDSAAEVAGGTPRLVFVVDNALGSYGIRELKRAVARDLEALLNTRQEALDEVPESLEEVRRSLVTYGLPDFSAASLQSLRDRTRIRRALEDTIAYVRERQAFGGPLSDKQVIRHKLADLATQIEAGRWLTYAACAKFAAGEECLREISMVKLFTAEMVNRVAYDCVQLHGGYGYMREYAVERFARDARLMTIGGGTSEIMRDIIARAVLP